MNFGTIDYASAIVPDAYRCTTCGVHGCKLWREYQTCADYSELVCCDCAGKSQKEDVSQIDERGYVPLSINGQNYGRTYTIGWRVPAIPTEEGDTYWGYTSVPQDGVNWWSRLPTRAAKEAK